MFTSGKLSASGLVWLWTLSVVTWSSVTCGLESAADDNIILQLQEGIKLLKLKLSDHDKLLSDYNELLSDHDAALSKLDEEMHATNASSLGGAVFTIWGRSMCGLNTSRVYSGLIGRSIGSVYGGGIDFQCLPHDPQYANYEDGYQYGSPGRGLIYSTEYQGSPDVIFDQYNLVGTTFVDQEAPCAVCHIANRTSVLMIPAQTTCPFGWTEEYWGYLMSSLFDGAGPSTYICVDHAPEEVNGAGDDHSGAHLYHVEMLCGSDHGLPCPNYIDGRELTCVVCSK